MIRAALILTFLAGAAGANELRKVPYDSLRSQPHRIETFDSLPRVTEPGINFDHHWRAPGLSIAEKLLGQGIEEVTTDYGRFDHLVGLPGAPPRVIPGQSGQNLTIAYHDGFGSNALFPLGPVGLAGADGRGEGSIAFTFDDPQFAFGLRLHAEYPDPLAQRPMPRAAEVTFYDVNARVLTRFVLPLGRGVMSLAWRSGYGVAAVTIENTDPGGVALDDILYEVEDLAG
ncbi:hypothetical protein MWU54_03250 [Marivita sp. S6314]|uniref:hypothetical protein n=1 Tax=Marivita sp. S6314 TaxID=2926406 RepID=UPI001FF40F2B|nr:hypothetical protein [Marivita sp. S6314]MCK0149028.1 hypothetical protein [Marivita sp. S6314]